MNLSAMGCSPDLGIPAEAWSPPRPALKPELPPDWVLLGLATPCFGLSDDFKERAATGQWTHSSRDSNASAVLAGFRELCNVWVLVAGDASAEGLSEVSDVTHDGLGGRC